jgi:hypothetical protein
MTSKAIALALLAATLAFAVVRPRGLPEAVAAVPAAVLVVASGGLTAGDALGEVGDLAPTVAFLAGSAVTAVLSLDATVVLLTPVVFNGRGPAAAAAQAARVCLHPPGQLGLAAAAGVQPHQPARLPGQRAVVRPLRGADGPALAGRHRGRVAGPASARPGTRWGCWP